MAITILSELGTKKISGIVRSYLLCRCEECGNTFAGRKDHVTRKKQPIVSCGCQRWPVTGRVAYNAKPEGVAAARNVFNSYRSKCKKKNILFEITFDEFRSITSRNCYYCDAAPAQEYSGTFKTGVRAGLKKVNGNYRYNGIDRINPEDGYVIGNVRPCCRYCNSAKLDRNEDDFTDWVRRLYANWIGGS